MLPLTKRSSEHINNNHCPSARTIHSFQFLTIPILASFLNNLMFEYFNTNLLRLIKILSSEKLSTITNSTRGLSITPEDSINAKMLSLLFHVGIKIDKKPVANNSPKTI